MNHYDAGIIAGDLMDDGIPDNELQKIFDNSDLSEDDFIPELPDADMPYTEWLDEKVERLTDPGSPLMRAMDAKETMLKEILFAAKKPVFLITGNHDFTPWDSENNIINIHNKRVELGNWNLVGCSMFTLVRDKLQQREHNRTVRNMMSKVDSKTIFVSHETIYDKEYRYYNPIKEKYENLGDKAIGKLVRKCKPLYHLYGHIHSKFGIYGNSINGSYPDCQRFISIDLDNGVSRYV